MSRLLKVAKGLPTQCIQKLFNREKSKMVHRHVHRQHPPWRTIVLDGIYSNLKHRCQFYWTHNLESWSLLFPCRLKTIVPTTQSINPCTSPIQASIVLLRRVVITVVSGLPGSATAVIGWGIHLVLRIVVRSRDVAARFTARLGIRIPVLVATTTTLVSGGRGGPRGLGLVLSEDPKGSNIGG